MRTKAQKQAGLTFDGEASYSMPDDIDERDLNGPAQASATPGPWLAVGNEIRAHGGIVAEINTIYERGEADARLIAAAPDLLAMCQNALEALTGLSDDNTCMSEFERAVIPALKAAIAKAGGWQVKGTYVMEAIPPYCAEIRTPATLLEYLPGGRVLLRDDSMPDGRFLIDTPASSFVAQPDGCNASIRVPGTNGGAMACGSVLVGLDGKAARHYCERCAH